MTSKIKDATDPEYYETTDALDDYGYVMALASTGKIAKAAANAKAFAICYKSTKHPVTGTAEANKQVAVVKDGQAWVMYDSITADGTISIGDLISVKGANTAGKVKKHAFSAGTAVEHTTTILEIQQIVGTALETKAAFSSGKIKTLLHPGQLMR